MPLHSLKVNPSGNITLFILDPVSPVHRPEIAAAWMRRDPTVEQVGFVVPPHHGGNGRVEMMGGEFCGNAARALGYFLALKSFSGGCHTIKVEVSGNPAPVLVTADLTAHTASAEMPLPRSVEPFLLEGIEGILVSFDGISHLALFCPMEEALLIKAQVQLSAGESDAFGVLFADPVTRTMTPVVTVRSTATTVLEGSCGSGSVAVGCVLALRRGDGNHCFSIRQPAGILEAEVLVQNGLLVSASIGGSVLLESQIELL